MSLITTKFGFHTTADEVVKGIDLSAKRAIVTGASSGIGIETARALALAGAEVTLAVRDTEAGKRVAADIKQTTGNGTLYVAKLDLTDRSSIADFVATWKGPLHILINNAGIMAYPELFLSREGWEIQFATNHMGHFALSLGLHDALAEAGNARIVSVSSSGHFYSPVIFDDLHYAFRTYDPRIGYGQSKTANILFAVEATKRWAAEGIRANSLMPGAIATNLQRYTGGAKTPPEKRKTPEEGASTSVLLAVSPELDGVGGKYFVNCSEAEIVLKRTDDMTGVAPYAIDEANAERLWDVSLELLATAKNMNSGGEDGRT